MQISATIICLNEAEKIGRCIESLLPVVDEVVVVDSGSTDATVQIAEALGARVSYHAFAGHIEQKNHAASLVQYDWILSLDADEALSDTLQASILAIKQSGAPRYEAYWMKRLNNFAGKWVKHGGWYPDKKIRFYRRGLGHWGGTNPHDRIELPANTPTGWLRGDLLHYSYDSLQGFWEQQERFAHIAGEAMFRKGRRLGVLPPWFRAAFRWLRDYVLLAGFLDGKTGWFIARGSAYYTWLKYRLLADKIKQNVR